MQAVTPAGGTDREREGVAVPWVPGREVWVTLHMHLTGTRAWSVRLSDIVHRGGQFFLFSTSCKDRERLCGAELDRVAITADCSDRVRDAKGRGHIRAVGAVYPRSQRVCGWEDNEGSGFETRNRNVPLDTSPTSDFRRLMS